MKPGIMVKKLTAIVLVACLSIAGVESVGSMNVVSAADSSEATRAEKVGKPNSWRYDNGERIEDESSTASKYARATTTATLPAGVKMLGIDVSEWNSKIDWATVKKSGQVDYVIVRCGYGQNMTSQDDDYWKENIQGCINNDIPFGVYIYSYADTATKAAGEAKHVIRMLDAINAKNLTQFKFPVYYDMEEEAVITSINKQTTNKSKRLQIYADMAETFCDAVSAAGYVPGVYANTNWFNTYLTDSVFDQWTKWVAQYNYKCEYTKPYDMWQYSASGKVNGIHADGGTKMTNVDMNYYYGTDFLQDKVAKVTGLKQTARSSSSVSISWSAVSAAAGYQVYRSSSPNGTYSLVKTTTSTSWKNSGRPANRQYYYKVRAYKVEEGKTVYGSYSSRIGAYTSELYQRTLTVKGTSYVRSDAGTDYSKVKTVKKGQSMSEVSYTYDKSGKKWYRVTFKVGTKSYKGYIRYDLVSVKKTVKTRTKVNMRKSASTKTKVVKSIPKNATLTYKGSKTVGTTKWYKVSYKKYGITYTGYIVTKYLKW